jgi:hypothetical protein
MGGTNSSGQQFNFTNRSPNFGNSNLPPIFTNRPPVLTNRFPNYYTNPLSPP